VDDAQTARPGVTTPTIDALLAQARDAGAWGGKVCGAGGGGCLFALARPTAWTPSDGLA
jgi:mevalonate kinase